MAARGGSGAPVEPQASHALKLTGFSGTHTQVDVQTGIAQVLKVPVISCTEVKGQPLYCKLVFKNEEDKNSAEKQLNSLRVAFLSAAKLSAKPVGTVSHSISRTGSGSATPAPAGPKESSVPAGPKESFVLKVTGFNQVHGKDDVNENVVSKFSLRCTDWTQVQAGHYCKLTFKTQEDLQKAETLLNSLKEEVLSAAAGKLVAKVPGLPGSSGPSSRSDSISPATSKGSSPPFSPPWSDRSSKDSSGSQSPVREAESLSQGLPKVMDNSIPGVSPDCTVVVVGLSTSQFAGPPGLAAFVLQLIVLGIRDVKSSQVHIGRRQVLISCPNPRTARDVSRQLHGQSISGQAINSFVASSSVSIYGDVELNSSAAPNPSAEALLRLERQSDEALYIHEHEKQKLQTEIVNLPPAYRLGFRSSENSSGFWAFGLVPNGRFSVVKTERANPSSFRFQADPSSFSHFESEDIPVGVVRSVYEEASKTADTVILRWVCGSEEVPKERFFVQLRRNRSKASFGSQATGPFQEAADAWTDGEFERPQLRRWDGSSGNETFSAVTWRWWLRALPDQIEAVREIFQINNDASSHEKAIVLDDLGCTTQIRIGDDSVMMRRGRKDAWTLVTKGKWSDATKTRWDSDASDFSQQYEAHFYTQPTWNGAWIDGSGDFSGVLGIYRQDTEPSASSSLILKSNNQEEQVTLTPSEAIVTRSKSPPSSLPGKWVHQPMSGWVSLLPTEAESKQREALEASIRQLDAVYDQFVGTCDSLRGQILATKPPPAETKALQLLKHFSRELARFQLRLPAYANRQQLIDAVTKHQVTILIGATGSGKSTQTLPFLVDSGILKSGLGKIACTQPRKVAAVSLADYVAAEWGCDVGQEVGVKCGGTKKFNSKTTMIYLTDRSLLNEIVKDKLLKNYDCVVIDEAHERSLNADLLFGFLKEVCRRRPEFRVIVSSATIEPALFMNYFGIRDNDAVVRIPGRTFPIEHFYSPRPKDIEKHVAAEVTKKTKEVLSRPGGDILIFVPTPDDVKECIKIMERDPSYPRDGVVYFLPLHGALDIEDQQKVFAPTSQGRRKVVFSTNIAETSVTIDGITAVIDSGLAKNAVYDAVRNMNTLVVGPITQSSVKQRAGRAGRTRPGLAYHLYDEDDVEQMPINHPAEILRTELLSAVLQLKELGIQDPARFDFIEHPNGPDECNGPLVQNAENVLRKLGFLDETGNMTRNGRRCRQLDIDCRLTCFLFHAQRLDCLSEAMPCAGILSAAGSLFFKSDGSTAKKDSLTHPSGDLMTYLTAYVLWKMECSRNRESVKQWCADHLLVPKVLKSADDFCKLLKSKFERDPEFEEFRPALRAIAMPFPENTWELLNRCFAAAYFDNVCAPNGPPKAGFLLVRDIPRGINGLTLDGWKQEDAERDEDDDDDDDGSGQKCSICMFELDSMGKPVKILPCGHSYHCACVINDQCPLCHSAKKAKGSVFIHPSSSMFQPFRGGGAKGGGGVVSNFGPQTFTTTSITLPNKSRFPMIIKLKSRPKPEQGGSARSSRSPSPTSQQVVVSTERSHKMSDVSDEQVLQSLLLSSEVQSTARVQRSGHEVTVFLPPGTTANEVIQSVAASAAPTPRTSPPVSPRRSLSSSPPAQPTWLAFHSIVESSKAFAKGNIKVDPDWEELRDINREAVEQEAKAQVEKVFLPPDVLPQFVGKQGSSLKHMESQLDVIISMPDRPAFQRAPTNPHTRGFQPPGPIEVLVYGSLTNVRQAADVIQGRIRLLEAERDERNRQYQERREEYEREKQRRELERRLREEQRRREYEERERERQRRHEEYLARQAERERRQREWEEERRRRAERTSQRPYCGTPHRRPPGGWR